MSLKNSLLVLGILLAACRQGPEEALPALAYHNPTALIEAGELNSRLGEPGIRIIDFRSEQDYARAHIPGAVSLWRSDIEDSLAPVPGMLAGKVQLESILSGYGITNRDTLIIYDDRACCDAARLWWALSVYGHDRVRLLNGGLHAWKAAEGALTTTVPKYPAADFRFPTLGISHLRIEADSLNTLLERGDCLLIDARSAEEFSGSRLKKGAARAGRIPGSHHRDWAGATHYEGKMTFRSPEEIQKIYRILPDDPSRDVVVYCHSGVRSAHTSFVLSQLLGYPRVRNYDGSWLEWSRLESLPIEKDKITTLFE